MMESLSVALQCYKIRSTNLYICIQVFVALFVAIKTFPLQSKSKFYPARKGTSNTNNNKTESHFSRPNYVIPADCTAMTYEMQNK